MRDLDEPIPGDEQLFRSIAGDEVDGDQLLPAAIELPAMSVNRSKYAPEPRDALRHDDTGIAVTMPFRLPVPVTSSGGVIHEFFAADVPSEGDSHAEIRLRRQGRPYDAKFKVGGKVFKLELKTALAKSFRVLIPPG